MTTYIVKLRRVETFEVEVEAKDVVEARAKAQTNILELMTDAGKITTATMVAAIWRKGEMTYGRPGEYYRPFKKSPPILVEGS